MEVPAHAAWFRLDAVDDVERRALPEFFDGSSNTKTPKSYMQMRNLIVATWREAPELHLSVTECRRHIAADVGSVMRLHQFLEHWGLINCTGVRASTGGPATNGAAPTAGGQPLCTDLSLRAPLVVGGGEWTALETLQLIEALDTLGPDAAWDDVASQLNRSTEECVAHFLALPIEEPHAMLGERPPTDSANAVPSDALLCQLALLARMATPLKSDGAANEAASSSAAALHTAARATASSVLARAVQMHVRPDPSLDATFAAVVEAQVKLVETKLAHLEEVSALVDKEVKHLERLRKVAAPAPTAAGDDAR